MVLVYVYVKGGGRYSKSEPYEASIPTQAKPSQQTVTASRYTYASDTAFTLQ